MVELSFMFSFEILAIEATKGQSKKSANNVKAANCGSITPRWGSPAPPMADDCTATIYVVTITDENGCVTDIIYNYQSHT